MNKGREKVFPFTKKQVDAKKLAIKEATSELEELKKAGRWDQALCVANGITERLQTFFDMTNILRHVNIDETSLRANNNARSWYLLGYVLYSGEGGVNVNKHEAHLCLCKAAELGHAVALRHKTSMEQNSGLSWDYVIISAQMGCILESSTAAEAYENGCASKYPQSYAMAAYWYQMAEHEKFSELLKKYPFECTPWGLWNPLDMDMQIRIMKPVRDAQFTWMMVSKQLQIPRGVALMITSLICTEPGWK